MYKFKTKSSKNAKTPNENKLLSKLLRQNQKDEICQQPEPNPSNLDKAVIETEVVSYAVLPPLFIVFVVGKFIHDKFVDLCQCQPKYGIWIGINWLPFKHFVIDSCDNIQICSVSARIVAKNEKLLR